MLFGCGIYLNYVSLQFYYSQTQLEVCITVYILRIYFSLFIYLFIMFKFHSTYACLQVLQV